MMRTNQYAILCGSASRSTTRGRAPREERRGYALRMSRLGSASHEATVGGARRGRARGISSGRTRAVLTTLTTLAILLAWGNVTAAAPWDSGSAGAGTAPAASAPAGSAAEPAGEQIALSWDGETYTARTTDSFFDSSAVLVPGDAASRTMYVRNDGPTAGTLRASIINVQIHSPEAPDVHHNPDHRGRTSGYRDGGDQGRFYEEVGLAWDGGEASFAELDRNQTTEILQVELGQGEQVPITLAHNFPASSAAGNRANVVDRLASFDVLLEIGGNLPAEPVTPEPPMSPSPTPAGEPQGEEVSPSALRTTGIGVRLVLVIAALALGAGLALRGVHHSRGRAAGVKA